MAKAAPDPLQASGEQLLAEWGIGADAAPAELAAVMHRDVAADAAIAHRLGGMSSTESASALQRLERDAADKRVRKEAKRALYRLEQRGVAIPPAPAEAAPTPVIATSIEGYVSPIDGRGDQLVWLVKAQAGGVAHLFSIVNDPGGLTEAELNVVSRKTLKSVREDLERKHELRLVPVDWRYADFLVQRAFEWSRARGTRIGGDYPGLRAQLTRQPPTTSLPALPQLEAVAAAADDGALASSAELLTQPEFRTWFLTAEDLRPDLEELASVKDSPLVLNPAQQQERFEAVINSAIDRWFGGDRSAAWTRRLFEMAVYLAASRRPQQAARALAVSRALEAGRPPRDLPLCSVLVRGSLEVFFRMAIEQEQEREKSSLVLTPQQAAARRDRTR
jgi:hypothetical protein